MEQEEYVDRQQILSGEYKVGQHYHFQELKFVHKS